tara:strand:- start:2686 stop:4794 length:2109 start_codon:yes stop_codon:yes gene_type:complete
MNDNTNITVSVEPPPDRLKSIKKLIELDDIKKANNEFNKLSSAFPKSNNLKKLARLLEPTIQQENKLEIKYENLFNTESETSILKSIKEDQIKYPNSSMLFAYIGRLQLSKKNYKEAIKAFSEAIKLNQDNIFALANLAVCYHRAGNIDNAIFYIEKALVLDTDDEINLANYAIFLMEKNEIEKSVKILNKLSVVFPNSAITWNLHGVFHNKYGNNPNKALEAFMKCKKIDPNYHLVDYNIGNVYMNNKDFLKANDSFEESIHKNQNHIASYLNMAIVQNNTDNYDKAIQCYNKVLNIDPEAENIVFANLINIYREKGEIDKAAAYCKKLIKKNKNYAQPYISLVTLNNKNKSYINSNDDEFKTMLDLFNNRKVAEEIHYKDKAGHIFKVDGIKTKNYLGFGIYKVLKDEKNFEEAIKYLIKANKSVRASDDFNIIDVKKRYFNTLKKYENRDLSKGLITNNNKYVNIFILGMPRSGSSLLEQILSRHSKINGLGELTSLPRSAEHHNYILKTKGLEVESLKSIAQEYTEEIDSLNKTECKFIIDKMPDNFLYIGLINDIFPDSIIIDIKRDALDTCFSIYEQGFTNLALYAFDQKEVAYYYNIYRKCMKFWHEKLKANRIYTLNYEDLVINPDKEIKNVLKHCSLDFEDDCLNFQTSKRAVRTASVVQVKDGLHSGSLNKWKHFEKHIQPMKEIIENEIIP